MTFKVVRHTTTTTTTATPVNMLASKQKQNDAGITKEDGSL